MCSNFLLCYADCKVDLAFLMDGSWSIGKRRFKIQKDFLSDVAQAINIGVAGPMMGIIQYGCVQQFSLSRRQNAVNSLGFIRMLKTPQTYRVPQGRPSDGDQPQHSEQLQGAQVSHRQDHAEGRPLQCG